MSHVFCTIVFSCLLTMLILSSRLEDIETNPFKNYLNPVVKMPGVKYILLYDSIHNRKMHISNVFNSCPVANCVITRNIDELRAISDFDAIIFEGRDLDRLKPSDLPNQNHRRPTQIYVMHLLESPIQEPKTKQTYDRFNNFFNWTMTYRLDSDIPRPYGAKFIDPNYKMSYKTQSLDKTGIIGRPFNYTQFSASLHHHSELFALARRPKAIAWMSSHCNTHSDREKYVGELRKHIPVDIFGSCSTLPTEYRGCKNCEEIIRKKYKFYLAFENAFCDDYVTEKLWTWLDRNVVPVVMGQGDYASITAPHSIINALDYPDPVHLAAFLNQLMKNDTEYLSYFWWKDYYVKNMTSGSNQWCRLCQKINDPILHQKTYDNLEKWWSGKGHCMSKGMQPWSKYKIPSFAVGKY